MLVRGWIFLLVQILCVEGKSMGLAAVTWLYFVAERGKCGSRVAVGPRRLLRKAGARQMNSIPGPAPVWAPQRDGVPRRTPPSSYRSPNIMISRTHGMIPQSSTRAVRLRHQAAVLSLWNRSAERGKRCTCTSPGAKKRAVFPQRITSLFPYPSPFVPASSV